MRLRRIFIALTLAISASPLYAGEGHHIDAAGSEHEISRLQALFDDLWVPQEEATPIEETAGKQVMILDGDCMGTFTRKVQRVRSKGSDINFHTRGDSIQDAVNMVEAGVRFSEEDPLFVFAERHAADLKFRQKQRERESAASGDQQQSESATSAAAEEERVHNIGETLKTTAARTIYDRGANSANPPPVIEPVSAAQSPTESGIYQPYIGHLKAGRFTFKVNYAELYHQDPKAILKNAGPDNTTAKLKMIQEAVSSRAIPDGEESMIPLWKIEKAIENYKPQIDAFFQLIYDSYMERLERYKTAIRESEYGTGESTTPEELQGKLLILEQMHDATKYAKLGKSINLGGVPAWFIDQRWKFERNRYVRPPEEKDAQ